MLDLKLDWIWEDWRVAVKVFLSAGLAGLFVALPALAGGATWKVVGSTWVAGSVAALKERLTKKPADQVHEHQRELAAKGEAPEPPDRRREWPHDYRRPRL